MFVSIGTPLLKHYSSVSDTIYVTVSNSDVAAIVEDMRKSSGLTDIRLSKLITEFISTSRSTGFEFRHEVRVLLGPDLPQLQILLPKIHRSV